VVLTRDRLTAPRPCGPRRLRSCPKRLQAFSVFGSSRRSSYQSILRPRSGVGIICLARSTTRRLSVPPRRRASKSG
jgi:hypothetical protein